MIFTQSKAPVLEAMEQHLQNRVVPFDVPGHKGGRGTKELTDFLGKRHLRHQFLSPDHIRILVFLTTGCKNCGHGHK